MHVISCAILVESCLTSFVIRRSVIKWLYNLFLAVKQTGRVSLVGFSDLPCHTCAVPVGLFFVTFLK